jgi:hypothetical protein
VSPLHIATSPLTNRIFVGRTNKAGTAFLAGKQDVTGLACAAVAQYALAGEATPLIVTANGKPKYEITVKEIP